MLAVHIRINDATTGNPTAVRLCVSAPDGSCFAPLGRAADFPTGRNEDVGGHLRSGPERWYYIDGSCEMPLPAAVPLRVRVAKGPEYTPIDETVSLGAGQMALRLSVNRWTDSRAEGWKSIDARCHFLTPHAALLEAGAEDLDVVNLLARPFSVLALDGNTYTTTPNLLAFSGQAAALEAGDRSVAVNTLNSHPVLGSVAILHSHRPVLPLTFGGEETDDWSLCDWCDQCHRKGGLTVWVDAFEPAGALAGGEALVAAILGKIDAIEVTSQPRKTPLLPWVYRLWDAGFLIPLVGASGKESNRVAMGQMRTLADCRESNWVEGVRAGRTIVSDGPRLRPGREGDRHIASATTRAGPARVEIVANGRVAASGEGQAEAVVEKGWVAARCQAVRGGFAHASAVGIGEAVASPDAAALLAKQVQQTQEWIDTLGRFSNPKRKGSLVASCGKALAILDGRR
jgi:hypothetical protein